MRIDKAFADGYTIVHKGLVCTTSIPSPTSKQKIKGLCLALEAMFTFVFWAMNTRTEYGFGGRFLCN